MNKKRFLFWTTVFIVNTILYGMVTHNWDDAILYGILQENGFIIGWYAFSK